MNQLFQEGVGNRHESSKGDVSQGRRGAPPITAKERGGGQIMLMCPFKTQYLFGWF